MKTIIIKLVHLFFGVRNINKEIKNFAEGIKNKMILEIGCGVNTRKNYFDKSNSYTLSDLKPILDDCIFLNILDINNHKNRYDVIVCINVLDDIYNYQKAVDNMNELLNPNGTIFLITPIFYPIHDIPNDFFRFTEFSLKKIFCKFSSLKITKVGLSRFPLCYVIEGIK